ncbi:MAG: hypothetical protein AB7O88_21155 [Reyranellaceae bacterium]
MRWRRRVPAAVAAVAPRRRQAQPVAAAVREKPRAPVRPVVAVAHW